MRWPRRQHVLFSAVPCIAWGWTFWALFCSPRFFSLSTVWPGSILFPGCPDDGGFDLFGLEVDDYRRFGLVNTVGVGGNHPEDHLRIPAIFRKLFASQVVTVVECFFLTQ